MKTDQLKYGRIERERRFLLRTVPQLTYDRSYRVFDRYIDGTRLRLRRMEDDEGQVAYKLARKLVPYAPGAGVMGNLYLDAVEYELLRQLPAHEIRKQRRYTGPWGVDVFEGVLDGLFLAEAEVDSDDDLQTVKPPFSYVADVTADAFFSGGSLCRCTRQEILRVLDAFSA